MLKQGTTGLLIATLWVALGRAEQPYDVSQHLANMLSFSGAYDPTPLHRLGTKGLAGVFDTLLPQSRRHQSAGELPLASPEQVREWIGQLGSETYTVREAATQGLLAQGAALRSAIEPIALSDDPEVRWRAKRILAHWRAYRAVITGNLVTDERYRSGLARYFDSMEERWCSEVITERIENCLSHGLPPEPTQQEFIVMTLKVVGRSGENQLCDRFEPLLNHEEEAIALLIARGLGEASSPKFCAKVLLKTLESKHDAVVAAGISSLSRHANAEQKESLHTGLQQILATRSEGLKFAASLTLTNDFQDEAARRYLIAHLADANTPQTQQALRVLIKTARPGEVATPAFVEALEPALTSPNHDLRHLAAKTLVAFTGEEVMRRAIPLLADRKALLATDVSQRLLEQPDQLLLKRLLTEATATDADPAIAKEAQTLLKKLK